MQVLENASRKNVSKKRDNLHQWKMQVWKMKVHICRDGKCGAFKYLCKNYNKAISACQTTLKLLNQICSCFVSNRKICRVEML